MSDAELIYNALLRAERRLEQAAKRHVGMSGALASHSHFTVQTIREEIGRALAEKDPA